MMESIALISGIIGVVSGAFSITTVFIRVGREAQARADLAQRHAELAKECREGLHERENEHDQLLQMIQALENQITEVKTRQESIRNRLSEGAASNTGAEDLMKTVHNEIKQLRKDVLTLLRDEG